MEKCDTVIFRTTWYICSISCRARLWTDCEHIAMRYQPLPSIRSSHSLPPLHMTEWLPSSQLEKGWKPEEKNEGLGCCLLNTMVPVISELENHFVGVRKRCQNLLHRIGEGSWSAEENHRVWRWRRAVGANHFGGDKTNTLFPSFRSLL